jgi:RNA polymerase sigma-70 factor (ECF subfamily)
MAATDRGATDAAITAVFREEAGRLTATLVGRLGNFDLAEDLVQDAILAALEHWPSEGIPDRPGAWLMTAARRRGIDRFRRDARYREKVQLLAGSDAGGSGEADDRLRLIFTCCHPSLAREAQVALTLRAVVGLTTPEIARAFLSSEAAIAQRIVRAKRKIVEAGIPYRVPGSESMGERLAEVLAVLYLMFNEGYLASGPDRAARHDLADDAEWLASLLARRMPREPEVLGLLALIRLHRARSQTRFDSAGGLVLLKDQDRGLWDRQAIARGSDLLVRASRMGRPGPYQIQAAIAACHAEATSWEATDWRQIVTLYDLLLEHSPTPVVRLNRAIAIWHVAGAPTALSAVDQLGDSLDRYHYFHSTRAELLRDLGRLEEARAADARALELTANPAERSLVTQRLEAD